MPGTRQHGTPAPVQMRLLFYRKRRLPAYAARKRRTMPGIAATRPESSVTDQFLKKLSGNPPRETPVRYPREEGGYSIFIKLK